MERGKHGNRLIDLYILFYNHSIHMGYMGIIRKTQILRAETLILHVALYLVFITMSKTKHPVHMVLLKESEQFVHISNLL